MDGRRKSRGDRKRERRGRNKKSGWKENEWERQVEREEREE